MCIFISVIISHGAPSTAFIFNICGLSEVEDMVAFTVALDGYYSPATGEKIPYNTIITNIGSGYITQRNEFVCPQAGLFVFYASVLATSDSSCRLNFYKDDEMIGSVYSHHSPYIPGSNMFLLELQEADTFSMRANTGCTMHGSANYNTFSGFKINYM